MADDKESESVSLTVDDALQMYEEYKSFWSENYRESNIDLKMAAGDPATHWGAAYDERKLNKQLTMVINELPQFIHQVTNDIRQNTPSVDTIPDSDGDIETAQVYSDLIRDIEYKSSADEAYDTGAEYAVKCAIGFIRVDHDYCDDESEEQELQIKKVHDPLSVWIDPASIECDGRDANGAIALEPINKKTFKRLYGNKAFVSFTDPKSTDVKDTIIIAEIFVREFTGKRGKTPIIKRYKFSGEDLLAETTFPGDYIPIVPIIGEDVWIDGKRILASLIRQARDPSLRLNHWACKEQQILNMAPIAPVMAEEGTLVNERNQWQSPGSEMVLEYRRLNLDGEPANIPTRLQPPPVPIGIINAMEGAKQNIKESLGMYNASIGEKSNETSGIAIQRRQHEGDVATFHFPDNVRRSITQVGRILASAIPVIYDTPRVVQTMSNENEPCMVGINGGQMQEGQKQDHHLTKGKYRVRVTTGSSYTTKRQEAAELFGDVIKRNPELLNVIGDLWAKNLDVAGAQAMAERFKKMIPPQLLADEQQQDPQVAQLTQKLQEMQQVIQQGAQEIQQLQSELQNKQGEQQLKSQELQIKAAELQQPEQGTDPMDIAKLQLEKEKDDREYEVKQRELAIKEFEAETKRMQAMQKSGPEQTAFKLDTTGFQYAKTPEQEAMESDQAVQKQMQEQAEMEMKVQQTNAVLQALGGISQQLGGLTQAVANPPRIDVIRDPNTGLIVGAQ